MSRYLVTMPQLGESVTEGTISRWLVNPGDRVAEFDAMVEINTDKVDAEVPAPVTGVLTEILAAEGAVVPVGADIAVLEVNGAAGGDIDVATIEVAATPAAPPARQQAVAQSDAADDSSVADVVTQQPDVPTPPRRRAASGPATVVAPPQSLEGDEVIPLTPTRRRIAERMALSKATIPHAWQMQEVDMSAVGGGLKVNRGTVRRQYGVSLSYLTYMVAAAAASLRKFPEVNSTFSEDGIIVHRAINIGVAMGLPEGVIVPVIKNADRLSIPELAVALGDLTARARARQLVTADLSGGTFTVNNSGSLGTLLSYSVIAPGQSAVITMGSVVDRPVAVNGKAEVRPMMYLSLSLDHRVMDGLQASSFLGACRQWLESVTPTEPAV
ncbi:MAG: dihydrolipoamide acetyltransferase family protein [Candidatus Dormiibacterota bacterium]